MPTSIHPATHIGLVALTVTDLERSLHFYQHLIGLRLHRRDGDTAYLGAGGPDVLVLQQQPRARRYRGVCGLYHFAILVPDRYALARALARLFRARYPNAPTDHIMTKATYLADPDGNGIEIYCESPEDGVFVMNDEIFFARRADGSLSDGRESLDVAAFFALLDPNEDGAAPLDAKTRIGHIHLHVADLATAVQFYHGVLGFDVQGVMRRFRMAMVSAGGYHHHIGLNTWQGEGAPPAPPDAAGLRWFSIVLPDQPALNAVLAQVRAAGVTCEQGPAGWRLSDPFGNGIVLTTASANESLS
ncbi:MAG: VOC family protein [Chloroflexus sp.]|nr:VOC family protein [Chloroflexus sp.]